jgi:hypothetical protein
MPGMFARQAIANVPELYHIAAGIKLNSTLYGVDANLTLANRDTKWNSENANKLREGLKKLKDDTKSYSPTLRDLMSRLSVSDSESFATNCCVTKDVLKKKGSMIPITEKRPVVCLVLTIRLYINEFGSNQVPIFPLFRRYREAWNLTRQQQFAELGFLSERVKAQKQTECVFI